MNIKIVNYLFVIVALIVLFGCNKNMESSIPKSELKYFYEAISIENSQEKFDLGDTIWFSANFKNQLSDSKTHEIISLENQTFMIRGAISLLMSKSNNIPFIYQNFDLVEDLGTIQLINVFNSSPEAYTFDVRFGRPLLTNEVRFGLVLNYNAIFAIEYEGWVFYGSERDNYDDFSLGNSKGYLNLSFSNPVVNDSIFYNLPHDYIYYFQNYYNPVDINSNRFYFFEVDQD